MRQGKAGNGFIVWTGLTECGTPDTILIPLTTGPVTSQLMIETSDKH